MRVHLQSQPMNESRQQLNFQVPYIKLMMDLNLKCKRNCIVGDITNFAIAKLTFFMNTGEYK